MLCVTFEVYEIERERATPVTFGLGFGQKGRLFILIQPKFFLKKKNIYIYIYIYLYKLNNKKGVQYQFT